MIINVDITIIYITSITSMMTNAHAKTNPVIPKINLNTINLKEINLNELPEDIVKKIYIDHFNYENRYTKIKNILDDEDSRSLNNTTLTNYFIKEKILEDLSFVQFLREKNEIFNEIYKIHYVDNIITFRLMNKLESMCQLWLMNLYH